VSDSDLLGEPSLFLEPQTKLGAAVEMLRPASDNSLNASVLNASTPYRVLARKYRPSTFVDLIGQEHMVRTLRNAFETGRVPQAWMLTGVRGVGKTTTARILARALNYLHSDGTGTPTVDMPTLGVHCEAIIEGRHIDVLEIDAASHNGVENIRQINDTVRYAPVSARTKVYIVDEVHMLSTSAFNAFLKTLEEPPPHAKFIFATTEIRKVPITILSRCQRFDLRRVEASQLVNHLRTICTKEHVTVEDEALSLIARASEGSVRDSLSLLDQAIAHGAGHVSTLTVNAMMGLADRAQVIDLTEALFAGHISQALNMLRDMYGSGADPAQVMVDIAEFVHLITRIKIAPQALEDAALSEIEKVRGQDCANRLSIRALSQAWQMLLKIIPEVQMASRPLATAEMALVRLAYMADMPPLDELLKRAKEEALHTGATGTHSAAHSPSSQSLAHALAPAPSASAPSSMLRTVASRGGAASASAIAYAPSQEVSAQPAIRLNTFAELVALAAEKRDITLQVALKRDVRPVRFEDGVFEFALESGASRTLAQDLSRKLQEWTGRRWMVAVSSQQGDITLEEHEKTQADVLRAYVEKHPLVQAVLSIFPDAKIQDIEPVVAEISDILESDAALITDLEGVVDEASLYSDDDQ
jgi:DNA polymerase III subunit gamma/tau